MAKYKKMFSLSQDALDELEALSANDTHKYNESSVVEALIHEAYAKRADHLKRIERVMDGRKLVGFNGYYGDHQVCYEEKTEVMARLKVDQYAYEELSK